MASGEWRVASGEGQLLRVPVVLVEVAVITPLVLGHVDAACRLDAQLARELGGLAESLGRHRSAHLF